MVVLAIMWSSGFKSCTAALCNDIQVMTAWALNCALRQDYFFTEMTAIFTRINSTDPCYLFRDAIQCQLTIKHLFYTSLFYLNESSLVFSQYFIIFKYMYSSEYIHHLFSTPKINQDRSFFHKYLISYSLANRISR